MSLPFEIKNIHYSYIDGGKKRLILDNLSYTFEPGVFYAILGPSGSGKTTLLALASALDAPESGQIHYNGVDIRSLGHRKFRKTHMAMIFQKYNLIPYLNGVENVAANVPQGGQFKGAERKRIAYRILEQVGIVRSKAERSVSKLSGGEQQRIAIARALAKDTGLILADEPTGALDTATANEVVGIFRMLAHELGKTVIIVTHSDDVAHSTDVVLRLKDGRLVPAGGPQYV